jgi:hypothetical protein
MTIKEFNIYCTEKIQQNKRENERADRRAALICCVIANLKRDPKRKRTAYKVDDFMPKEKKKMSANQLATMLEAFTLACGGEVSK